MRDPFQKPAIIEIPMGQEEFTLRLAEELTSSAFGHQYAVMNLEQAGQFSDREAILTEMEFYRDAYLSARWRLDQIDPERLTVLEEDLRLQKQAILDSSPLLH